MIQKRFLIIILPILLLSCKTSHNTLVRNISLPANEYEFDYFIQYDYQKSLSSKKERKYILTNSKKNNYFLLVENLDSLNYVLTLKDQEKLYSKFQLPKEKFNISAEIELDCDLVVSYNNLYKYQTKNYAFTNLKDTIINDSNYRYYKLQRIKPSKKKPIGRNHYIIEKNTQFHLPILLHSTAYEEYKIEKNIVNGIFKMKFFENSSKEIQDIYSLINYKKSNRKIIIERDCYNINFK